MAFSKAGHYTDPLIDELGKPQRNVTVTVYARGTTNLATLWTSRLKATQASNPTSSDASGNLSFYADPGEYDLLISGTTIPITVPLDPLEVDTELGAGGDLPIAPAVKRYYVEESGNDSNDGLSLSTPVLTLNKALELTKAAGGGHIFMGAGVFPQPTNARQYINQSNVTIEGIPGLTIIRAMAINDGSFYIGLDTFTAGGGQYEQVHLYGLTIDQSAANQSNLGNANTVIFSGVKDSSIRKCVLMGGNYMMSIGGGTKPPTRILVEDNLLIANYTSAAPVAFAIVNSKDCIISKNQIYAPTTQTQEILLLDAEPNELYNYNQGLIFSQNIAERAGAIITQPGGATDERRLTGVQIIDNVLFNCGTISIGTPQAVVARNIVKRDRNAPTWAQQTGIYINHVNGNTVISPHHTVIEGNILENLGGATNLTPVIKLDSSHNTVKGNKIIETRNSFLSRAIWGVEEVQVSACLVSGGALGTPSGMTIPLSALEVQAANAGTVVSRAAQTVTIPAANTYERLDAIFVAVATGDATVYSSPAPPTGVDPGPANAPTTSVPIANVRVPANATSIAAADIFDRRYFRPDHNEIDQEQPAIPLRRGTVKLRTGSTSLRTPRRRERITDAYAKSVMEDAPVAFWPLLETTGPLIRDISGQENDAVISGGVLLNQTVGTRKGAKFDGTNGYVHTEVRPETRFRGPFTIEMQLLPDNLSGFHRIIGQGYTTSSNPSFHLFMRPTSGLVDLVTGNQTAQSTTALGTANLTHLAVVYDGTDVRFYFGGTLGGTTAISAPTYGTSYEDWPVMIGASDTNSSGEPTTTFFPGFIRNVALYDKALSSTRVSAHAGLM